MEYFVWGFRVFSALVSLATLYLALREEGATWSFHQYALISILALIVAMSQWPISGPE
jgi:hypothetical protein